MMHSTIDPESVEPTPWLDELVRKTTMHTTFAGLRRKLLETRVLRCSGWRTRRGRLLLRALDALGFSEFHIETLHPRYL